ncbi:transcription antitermination factor NusB [Candidatus Mycoplasma pogonae]
MELESRAIKEMEKEKKYSADSISTRRSSLEKIIAIIYMFEVQKEAINLQKILDDFELKKGEIKKIEMVKQNYDFFKKNIENSLSNGWKWARLSPFIRAVLLLGSLELLITSPALTINEMVDITKEYTLPEVEADYKTVNFILDRLSKIYAKVQQS